MVIEKKSTITASMVLTALAGVDAHSLAAWNVPTDFPDADAIIERMPYSRGQIARNNDNNPTNASYTPSNFQCKYGAPNDHESPGPVNVDYAPGTVITLGGTITANHGGYSEGYWYTICQGSTCQKMVFARDPSGTQTERYFGGGHEFNTGPNGYQCDGDIDLLQSNGLCSTEWPLNGHSDNYTTDHQYSYDPWCYCMSKPSANDSHAYKCTQPASAHASDACAVWMLDDMLIPEGLSVGPAYIRWDWKADSTSEYYSGCWDINITAGGERPIDPCEVEGTSLFV
jgi:hypothetical protein